MTKQTSRRAVPRGSVQPYRAGLSPKRTEIARSGSRMTESRLDAYGYNDRNELTSATKLGGPASVPATLEYAYQYDDIGNRITSTDITTNRTYVANSLNQYSAITTSDLGLQTSSFEPQFDDDGNQTLIQTSTGIWQVQYNGENRPVLWTGGTQAAMTNIVMSFDRMGRRIEYRETQTIGAVGGNTPTTTINTHHRFVYDDYLCIQRLDAADGNAIDLTFVWDVTELIATRPLVLLSASVLSYYTHDGNKNVSEVVADDHAIVAQYGYAPFGALKSDCSEEETVENPFGYSSEHRDDVIGLIYFNYRCYDFSYAAWISRDIASEWLLVRGSFKRQDRDPSSEEQSLELSLYRFVFNSPIMFNDFLGCFYPGQGRIGPPLSLPNKLEGESGDKVELDYISNSEKDPGGYEKLARSDHFWYLRPYHSLNSSSDFKPNDVLEKSSQCISSLLVISHGGYVFETIKGGGKKIVGVNTIWGRTTLKETDEKTEISNMFKNIRFCSKCKLELRACFLGSNDILKERLQKNTGCAIILFEKKVNPYGEPIVETDN